MLIYFFWGKKISSRNLIEGLTKMLSKSGWLRNHLAYKYMKCLKLIYTFPYEVGSCDKNIVYLYQSIFKGISFIFLEIKNYCLQFEKTEFLRLEMMLLIYEISNCLKTICEQLHYVVWNEKNPDAKEMNKHETKEISLEDRCIDLVLNDFISFDNIIFIIKLIAIYTNLSDNNYE